VKKAVISALAFCLSFSVGMSGNPQAGEFKLPPKTRSLMTFTTRFATEVFESRHRCPSVAITCLTHEVYAKASFPRKPSTSIALDLFEYMEQEGPEAMGCQIGSS
jgi:hypothetical protein